MKKPDKTKMIIMGSPVGPYYATGYKAISLYCTDDFIRAAPKGTGHYKVGGYSLSYLETMHLPLDLLRLLASTDINRCYGFGKAKC